MPRRRVGENVPLVTVPDRVPSAVRTSMCGRGMPRPSHEQAPQRAPRAGLLLGGQRVAAPERGFFHPTAQPARACTGEMSGDRSLPCSG